MQCVLWVSDSFLLKVNQQWGHLFPEITWYHIWSLFCLFPLPTHLPILDRIAQSSIILRAFAEATPSASTHFPRHSCDFCPPFPEVSVQMSPVYWSWPNTNYKITLKSMLSFIPTRILFTALDTLWCLLNIFICFYSSSITGLQWLLVFSILYSLPRQCPEHIWHLVHLLRMCKRYY